MAKAIAGFTATQYWCRECAPEGVTYGGYEVYDEEQYGFPYSCDICGEDLKPCEHDWEEVWHDASPEIHGPNMQINFCRKDFCGSPSRMRQV